MISAALSVEDYIAALRLHRRRTVRRQLLVLAILAAAGLVVMVPGPMLPGLVLVGAGVGGLMVELLFSKFGLPRRARRIYAQQASLRASYTYSWDELGLSVEAENASARRPWSDYIKFLENEHLFLLYHSEIMFEIFPRTWFSSKEQETDFHALASQVGA